MINKYIELNNKFNLLFNKRYNYICVPILLLNDKDLIRDDIYYAAEVIRSKYNDFSVYRGNDSIIYNTFLSIKDDKSNTMTTITDKLSLISDYFCNMYSVPSIPFIFEDINVDELEKAKNLLDKLGYNQKEYADIFAPLYITLIKLNLNENDIINSITKTNNLFIDNNFDKVHSLFLSLICTIKQIDSNDFINKINYVKTSILNKKIKINKEELLLLGLYCCLEENKDYIINSIEILYSTLKTTKGFKKKTCLLDSIVINCLNFDDKELILNFLIIFEGICSDINSFYFNPFAGGHYGK